MCQVGCSSKCGDTRPESEFAYRGGLGGNKTCCSLLKATKEWKLSYGDAREQLVGYSDADGAGDASTKKSTSEFVFNYAGGTVSWVSRRHSCVTLTSMESENVALSEASQELIWLRSLLADMGEQVEDPVTVLLIQRNLPTWRSEEHAEDLFRKRQTATHFKKYAHNLLTKINC
ncbi:hypothetical protein RP20_CCG010916 [Aedes albopictus]|nr:hypothetical protein RP20_CCG010916 [Aedes albopictus]